MISQKLSNSLRVANIICTLLVVAIHYNTKHDMDLSQGWTWNYYFQEFITNGVARIAVPFFAFSSGLFFFLSYKSFSSYPRSLNKRIYSLLIPYLIASTLIFIVEYLYGKVIWDASSSKLSQLIIYLTLKPISVHFWFLRDLMFLVLISPAIFTLVNKLKLYIIVPVIMLWFLDIEIMPTLIGRYFISIETLSYFMLGCYCSQRITSLEYLIKTPSTNTVYLAVIIYVVLCVLRIYIEPDMANWYVDKYQINSLIVQNISIFMGVFIVIFVSDKMVNQRLLYLSQFTFFVYIFHLLPLSHLVGKITSYMISDPYKFYLTFPLATILVFITAYVVKEKIPLIYKLLSGNR